jgi:hypothetical protein
MNPDSEKKAIVTDPLAAVNRGFLNKPTSIIGSRARRSHEIKATSSPAAARNPAIVRAEPQPWAGASMIVKINSAMPALDSARPGRSARGAVGSREVGTVSATSPAVSTATGASAKKMLGQLKCSSRKPPLIGPSATPRPAIAPHSPIASARSRRSVNTLAISDSVAGKITAAPKPITQRAAIKPVGVLTSPPTTLPSAKMPNPTSSIPFRPTRSETLPAASTSAANTRLYASTIHCS